LPQFLRDLLSAPPQHGDANGGVHRWLFRMARQLHYHRSDADICALLAAATQDCGRRVPKSEIWDAIKDSRESAWSPEDNYVSQETNSQKPKWPAFERSLRLSVIRAQGATLYDLWECSPVRFDDGRSHASEVIQALFPGDPLVCIARNQKESQTANLSSLLGCLDSIQFIVPSPMSKPVGINQDGKESPRCLDNTGSRAFLVVEFDSGSLDDQAALLLHLARFGPLVLVVHSGSKSLHGWFGARGVEQTKLEKFFAYASRLGADPATWIACQLVRAPGGRRENGRAQAIYYFDPQRIHLPHECQ
jgi:hypothetical protein